MIAKCIQYKGNIDYNYDLNKTVNSLFTFKNVDEETVKNTINNLPQNSAVDLMEFDHLTNLSRSSCKLCLSVS